MHEHSIKNDIFKILRLISNRDDISQRYISTRLGISLGKVNYLLKSLAKKGFIEVKEFIGRGRKLNKVQYILTKKGLNEKSKLIYYFLRIREKEYMDLKKESENNCKLNKI